MSCNLPSVAFALVLIGVSGSPAYSQSFDCSKASSVVEKLICSDPDLKALDSRMSELYARALKILPAGEQSDLRTEQRGWLKARDACATANEPRKNCVANTYSKRNSRLDGLLAKPDTSIPAAADQGSSGTSQRLNLSPGGHSVVQEGIVTGRETASYLVAGHRGQTLVVTLKTSSTSLYFNVLPSGSPEAVYASDREASGNSGSVTLPADGDYQIQVYLFRNAARRGSKAAFSLSVSLK